MAPTPEPQGRDRDANCRSDRGERFSPAVWFGRLQHWLGAQPLGKGRGAAGTGAQLPWCQPLSWPHSSWGVLWTTCPWGEQRIKSTARGCDGRPLTAQDLKHGKKETKGKDTIYRHGGNLETKSLLKVSPTEVRLSMSWGPWGLTLHLSGSTLWK